jgi:hypothetical protein
MDNGVVLLVLALDLLHVLLSHLQQLVATPFVEQWLPELLVLEHVMLEVMVVVQ